MVAAGRSEDWSGTLSDAARSWTEFVSQRARFYNHGRAAVLPLRGAQSAESLHLALFRRHVA